MRVTEDSPAVAVPRNGSTAFRTSLRAEDVNIVRRVTENTGFFSPAEVAVSVELVEAALHRGAASGYSFLFAARDGQICGYTCYGAVPCTSHSYDLYWIVVDADYQGQGVGRLLLTRTEELILATAGRQIYAETSSRRQYHPTRSFYRCVGFKQVARLKDFYARGDSKVIYCKTMSDASAQSVKP